MKNSAKTFLVIIFLLIVTSPILAINSTASPNSSSSGLNKEIKIETAEEKVASIAGRLDVRKKEVIKNYFHLITTRIEAAINRLNKLVIRIESRIAKIEKSDKKIKVSSSKQQLIQAKENLASASAQLKEIENQMDIVIESNTPNEDFKKIKNMVTSLKKNLIETQKILTKVIGEIKGLQVGQTATTSALPKEVD
ncbi:MAG: hypothetical protein NT052_00735 [Candidatus Shapirobacteria bacterium]|nr:hypothetical protein [Candidatus Shapirobacteria bacterium]